MLFSGVMGIISTLPVGVLTGVVSLIGGLCGVFIVCRIQQLEKGRIFSRLKQ